MSHENTPNNPSGRIDTWRENRAGFLRECPEGEHPGPGWVRVRPDEWGARLKNLQELVTLQCEPDTWMSSNYDRGLANGLKLSLAIMSDTEFKPLRLPEPDPETVPGPLDSLDRTQLLILLDWTIEQSITTEEAFSRSNAWKSEMIAPWCQMILRIEERMDVLTTPGVVAKLNKQAYPQETE